MDSSISKQNDENERRDVRREYHKGELFDKIKGIIYGAALGNAFGLSTDCMTEQQARNLYGDGPIQFGKAVGHEFWRDNYRSQWFPNDFTGDTDQMLLILQCILSTDGRLIPNHFAFRLKEWSEIGFPELNKLPLGIGYTVGSVLSHPDFLSNPHKASYDIWDSNGRELAANGAIMRTAVLGIPFFWNEEKVVENSIFAAKVTHADPRSVISAVIVNVIISNLLLQDICEIHVPRPEDKFNSDTENKIRKLLKAGSPHVYYNIMLSHNDFKLYDEPLKAKAKAQPPNLMDKPKGLGRDFGGTRNFDPRDLKPSVYYYKEPNKSRIVKTDGKPSLSVDMYRTDKNMLFLCKNIVHKYEFILNSQSETATPIGIGELHAHCFPSKLADLKLSESEKIGYTFKCLGSAIYCLTRARPAYTHMSEGKFFKTVITELTLQAGDADTNCAVAGALLGCRLGMKDLPKDWLDGLRHSEFLEDIANQLCDLVWSKYNER